VRWIFSHIWHYPVHLLGGLLCVTFDNVMFSLAPVLIGQAAALILQPSGTAQHQLLLLALEIMIVLVLDGAANMTGFFAATHIGASFAADARQEPAASLWVRARPSRPAAGRRPDGARHRRCQPVER
jgi:hypothetical protein